MAIHNQVILFGKVLTEPQIVKNENGEEILAKFALSVIRNEQRKTGNVDENIKYDSVPIITKNKEMIQKIKTLKKEDVIQLKSVFITSNTLKSKVCTHCNHINKIEGVNAFINPIYLKIIKQNNTPAEALQLLKESQEISNLCTMIGTLCSEPELYLSSKGTNITQYQLAINRKYKVKEDAPEIRTDYPWVKSYDENAELDAFCLKKGSTVFIDGVVQSRAFPRNYVCSSCNENFTQNDTALEIVPYEIEYLRDFVTPEEKEKHDSEVAHNLVDELLG